MSSRDASPSGRLFLGRFQRPRNHGADSVASPVEIAIDLVMVVRPVLVVAVSELASTSSDNLARSAETSSQWEDRMSGRELTNTEGRLIGDDSIEQFQARFRGDVIRPGDAPYDTARKIWNASVDKHPGMIVRCRGVADVVDAVNFARENELLLAVRGGGHNVGGRALCDGGMVIDFCHMKGVHVDTKQRRARVQAGATLGDVDRETHIHGLAVPAGVVSATGIAGLTLGGGVGWLVRKHGLTCDNVVSFDVVTAGGELLTANAEDNADLFWALRGGGGNFGVVTSFEYRVHPVATVLGGMIVYPRDQAVDVLRFYRDFTESAPEELTAYAGLLHTPDGVPAVAVIPCYCGELAEGERVLQPLRAFGAPLLDAIGPLAFPQMQSMLDGAFPDGTQNYWKSTFLRELSDEAIDILVDHGNQATSPQTAVVVEYYGGAASRVDVSDTAFGHREAQFAIGILSQWSDPEDSERHIAWARDLAGALDPYSSGAYLLNFLGIEGEDTIRAAFGPNYQRLVEVKNKYDPTNFFRINQNIKPTV
jgi:FAD/FMN-containing dehydrogenase